MKDASHMVDIAVVIVNYNTREELNNCLRSLPGAASGVSARVIVVDNHSSDGSADMVRRMHPWVSDVLVTEVNGGYAYANNIGLRAAGIGNGQPERGGARYYLLLNPDTVLPEGCLAHILGLMDANTDVGVCGPRLIRQDGSLDKACRRSFPSPKVSFYHFSGLSKLFPKSPVFARYNLSYLDPGEPAEVDSVVGAFMLIRAAALEQAGLLDETFFMYGEDIDLCYRIKQNGWRVMYYPQVTVLHVKGASSRKSSSRAIMAFYEAMRIFHNKHYRKQSSFLVNALVDGGISVMQAYALFRDRLRSREDKRVASA